MIQPVLWCALLAALGGCNSTDYDASRVFRYNESANLTSLDPAFARTLEPMWVVDQLYDGLVELDANLNVHSKVSENRRDPLVMSIKPEAPAVI